MATPKATAAEHYLFGPATRNVEYVAGMHLQVFGFTIENFLEVHLRFRLFALIVLANDYGVIRLGDIGEPTRKREHLESSELRTIVGNHEATRAGHRPKNIDNARVGNGDHIAALQRDVIVEVACFQELI